MSLFENQIKTLITTLENIPDPESFDISDWHSYKPHVQCGFAACICGHQALAPTSEFFVYSEKPLRYIDDAISIAQLLDISCTDLTGDTELAESIYHGGLNDRRSTAYFSEVFSSLELDHPFLNNDYPSIEEAISYLRLVLTKLGDFDD
jgi:hypothetical protein